MLERQLEVFRAVMETGSATLAAQQLGLSQPSVSRQLAQLQEAIGLGLFRRQNGKLVPTAHAAALYPEALATLQSMDRFASLTASLRAHDAGVLRIAAVNSFCEAFVPGIIARLVERHKNLRYSVEIARYREVEALLLKREVDLGILRGPVTDERISSIGLVQCRSVCAVPVAHRLARKAVLSIDDLASEPLILLGRNTQPRMALDALLRGARKVPVVRMNTQSVSSACGFVASGLGIAVVPELLAVQFAGHKLALKRLEPVIHHDFVIASPAGSEHGLLSEFVAEAKLALPNFLLQD